MRISPNWQKRVRVRVRVRVRARVTELAEEG